MRQRRLALRRILERAGHSCPGHILGHDYIRYKSTAYPSSAQDERLFPRQRTASQDRGVGYLPLQKVECDDQYDGHLFLCAESQEMGRVS